MSGPPAGLCGLCRHARVVSSARGSRFWRCDEAARDPSLRKYPALPRLACHAFTPARRYTGAEMPTRDDLADRYPTNALLRDGTAIVFRPMTADDGEAVLAFARALPEDDLLFLREDITAPEVVADWLAEIAGGAAFTVLAEVGGVVVGYASLHTEPARWTRHVGEIRINVHPDYRGTGVGAALAGEIRHVAPALGVRTLTAQMTVDQATARIVFERLGFHEQAVLAGWVTDRAGVERDLVVMARALPDG